MIKPRYLIGFTGHRTGYDETTIASALTRVLGDLKARIEKVGGRAELYASVAEGSDTLCVEVARRIGLPTHLLLPLPEVEFAKDFSSPEAWERSKRQLDLARQRPGRDSALLSPNDFKRPDCYFDQAMRILDAVDVLVAVWDNQPSRGLGGTAQVVAQATNIGIPVVHINSTTGQSEIAGNLEACFVSDAMIAELNEMMQKAGISDTRAIETADQFQNVLDKVAVVEASRFRPSLVATILLHGIAALLAAIVTFKLAPESVWEKSKWALTATELMLVTFALWMGVRLNQKHTQERWIRCRFACELVRGLRTSVPLLDPLHPVIGVHEPQWRRFALTIGLLVNRHQTTTDATVLRDRYLATRLSETDPEGQILHYRTMQPRALWWWDFTGLVSKWSAILAPPFVLLSLLNKLSKHLDPGQVGWKLDLKPETWPFVVLLPIALPLFAGMAKGIRQALDAGRRKERYPKMATRLMALRTRLQGLETRATIVQTVAQTEDILLDELREWQLTATTTGH